MEHLSVATFTTGHSKIIAPYFIDGTLNSCKLKKKNKRILEDDLSELLEDISLEIQFAWLQPINQPSHTTY